MRGLQMLSLILLIIGGLNWLLVGLFKWDLVGGLFGGMDSGLARTIYVIVGIAALYALTMFNNLRDDHRTADRA